MLAPSLLRHVLLAFPVTHVSANDTSYIHLTSLLNSFNILPLVLIFLGVPQQLWEKEGGVGDKTALQRGFSRE